MIYRELGKLEEEGKHITIGMSGAGWMGSGFIAQMRHVPGMRVAVLADEDTKKAYSVFTGSGVEEEDVVQTDSPGRAADAVRTGKCVVTGDYTLAAGKKGVLYTVSSGDERKLNALPVGLAPGARMKRDVWKDKLITWDDVELDESSILVRLRRMQDGL